MAGEIEVDWPTCRAAECIGVRLDTGTCLTHADDQARRAAFQKITQTGKVDARGVTISPELLRDILAAAPTGDDGHRVFAGAWFDGATFTGDARFDEAHFTGDARFAGATFTGGAWFDGADFTGVAWFDGAHFTGVAEFGGAHFTGVAWFDGAHFTGVARFVKATFTGVAWFDGAHFTGVATFGGATFTGGAWFDGADFTGGAWFAGATFTAGARFGGATFAGDAGFAGATFAGGARFAGATFTGGARFDGADFERTQYFGPVLVQDGHLYFDDAVFREPVVIEASAAGLSCRRTRFPAGVQLRLRRARVVLEDTDLSAPSLMTGIPRLSDDELADADAREYGDGQSGQPRIISLRRANVAGLGLSNVSLAGCRFAGAHNLDLMRLDGDITFGLSPARAGWERRQVLAEEAQWRAHARPGQWAAPPWPEWAGDEPAAVDPGTVAGIYRALRKGREDARDQPGAADFYYGEMEMRRHTTGPASERETGSRGRADRAILTLYWLASGYGLRAWRSFTALAALAVVITGLMTGWGLAAAVAPQTLHGTSTAGRITATLTPTTPQPPPAGQRWTAERVRTSAEITLDAFVFRATDLPLTPAGAWIEDLARILGPLLLALGLLAVRNRVKR